MNDVIIPKLNRVLLFYAEDTGLRQGQSAWDSPYLNSPEYPLDEKMFSEAYPFSFKPAIRNIYNPSLLPMMFVQMKPVRFWPWNMRIDDYAPPAYIPHLTKRSDGKAGALFICTMYHYLQIGSPKGMLFRGDGADDHPEVTALINIPKRPSTYAEIKMAIERPKQGGPKLDLNMYRISETGSEAEEVFEKTGDYPQDTHITVSREGDVRIELSGVDDYVTNQEDAVYDRFKRNPVELRGKVERYSEETDPEGRTFVRMSGMLDETFSYHSQSIYGWLPREDEKEFANFFERTLEQALPRNGDPVFIIEFYPEYNYCSTYVALHGYYKHLGWYLGEEIDPYEERSYEDCIQITLSTDIVHP